MGLTISEKIFRDHSNEKVVAGDFTVADIDIAMAHDGTAPLAIDNFEDMGGKKVWDPSKIVLILDHLSPSPHTSASIVHKQMREFARKYKIQNFFDIGSGVCHQILPEKGFINTGNLVVGADSHTCTHGALGAFSTGIGSTDMAAVFYSGKLWFRVPETFRIEVSGKLHPFVLAKDLILHIIGQIRADGATYKAVEFCGETVKGFDIASRMTLCNMAVEMGAKTGLVSPDKKTLDYLENRVPSSGKVVENDPDAEFEETFNFEVDDLSPQIAYPPFVDNVRPIEEYEGTDVDQIFLGSCTNGRLEDLQIAAKILDGKKIHEDVRMIVMPASRDIYLRTIKDGLAEIFLNAGCCINNPGCGPCVGGHAGILAPGEVCLSTTNRNFEGRMGEKGQIYLGSPATAAATALKGVIADPRELEA
ncbi:MAG: 3-isopropylmalate dehydratase large subunit [Candidatus Bathyarchaeota archaeon]|nr:MAG: 3-isopropylmalate dehydratase large subunit [Candidatus Bathyarchaeota archaeon]